MSTTYYVADHRCLSSEQLERAQRLDLSEARICTIAGTKIGGVAAPTVILYMSPEQIASYPDDVRLARNNGGGVLTMGELKPLIESGIKISDRDYLEIYRDDLARTIRKFFGREIGTSEDLTKLFE